MEIQGFSMKTKMRSQWKTPGLPVARFALQMAARAFFRFRAFFMLNPWLW